MYGEIYIEMYVADHTYFFYLHLETILLSLSSRELSVGLACMYCSYFDEVHEASKNRNLAIKTIPLDKKMKSRWRNLLGVLIAPIAPRGSGTNEMLLRPARSSDGSYTIQIAHPCGCWLNA